MVSGEIIASLVGSRDTFCVSVQRKIKGCRVGSCVVEEEGGGRRRRKEEEGWVEVVKTNPQERISERMCEQSEVIKVNETSSQDQIWRRAMEQSLDDTWHEPASRFFETIREKMGEGGEKEKHPSIFVAV